MHKYNIWQLYLLVAFVFSIHPLWPTPIFEVAVGTLSPHGSFNFHLKSHKHIQTHKWNLKTFDLSCWWLGATSVMHSLRPEISTEADLIGCILGQNDNSSPSKRNYSVAHSQPTHWILWNPVTRVNRSISCRKTRCRKDEIVERQAERKRSMR